MQKRFFTLLVCLCLAALCGCGRGADEFADYRGDLSADLRYTLCGRQFAARFLRKNGEATLTFTAPAGLCGCTLARRDGEVALTRGDLTVKVRGEGKLPCALFDFAVMPRRRTAEGFLFSDGGTRYTVRAHGGGIDRITLCDGEATLSAEVDDIRFLGGGEF